MFSKYLRRPLDVLGQISLAQFAKMYTEMNKRKESEEETSQQTSESTTTVVDDEIKFDYIMTDDPRSKKLLPLVIELNNSGPGESRCMKKRSFPAALRFNKAKFENNPDEFMYQ